MKRNAVVAVLASITLMVGADTSAASTQRRDCSKIHHTTETIARCHIYRAAKRYHQPNSDAVRVARCESGFRWFVSGHHQGLYQFLFSTYASTPYAGKNIYSPKWNSLAAMWMWAHGRRGEWQCQ